MSPATHTAEDAALDAVAHGTSDNAFASLGRHELTHNGRPAVVIRTMQPAAAQVELLRLPQRQAIPMERRHPNGLFEVIVPLEGARAVDFDYRLRVVEPGGHAIEVDDPYRYGQVLSDFDLHLFAEGTHYRAWEILGPHCVTVG